MKIFKQLGSRMLFTLVVVILVVIGLCIFLPKADNDTETAIDEAQPTPTATPFREEVKIKVFITKKIVDAIWEPLNDDLIRGFIRGEPEAMAYVCTTAEIVLAEVKRQNGLSADADISVDDEARAAGKVAWSLISTYDSLAVLCSEIYHRMLQNPDKVSKRAVADLSEFVFIVTLASKDIDYDNEENPAIRFILRRLGKGGYSGLGIDDVNLSPEELNTVALFGVASCGNGIPGKWSKHIEYYVPFYEILKSSVKTDLSEPSSEKYGIGISDDATTSPTPVPETPDTKCDDSESGGVVPTPAKTKVTVPSFL